MEYPIAEKTKTIKKEIPPKDGFDSLLQRIVTSFLFLIPNEREKRNNRPLHKNEIKNPPIPNPTISKILNTSIYII